MKDSLWIKTKAGQTNKHWKRISHAIVRIIVRESDSRKSKMEVKKKNQNGGISRLAMANYIPQQILF